MRVIVVGSHTNPVISTYFAVSEFEPWKFPQMFVQIENRYGYRIRIHFPDPDALNSLARALRTLQDAYRTYLEERNLRSSFVLR